MADLQELFARLKSPSNPANAPPASSNDQQLHGLQPSVSSPILSPSPSGPQPHHPSAILSPNTSVPNTPAVEMDRSANLLNLLRFNSNAGASASQDTGISGERRPSASLFGPTTHDIAGHGRAVSASDLVASFMRKPPSSAAMQSPPPIASPASNKPENSAPARSSTAENPQDLLLRLLNQAKPPQTASASVKPQDQPIPSVESQLPETAVDDLSQDLADAKLEKVDSNPNARQPSPVRVFGQDDPESSTTFTPPPAATKKSMFTYVNPFEQLSASSPRNRTPQPEARSSAPTPKMEILKHERSASPGLGDAQSGNMPSSKARKLGPGSPRHSAVPGGSAENAPRGSVPEALSGVGEQVNRELEEALAKVDLNTKDQANFEADKTVEAEDAKDAQEAVIVAAKEIKEELKDEEARKVIEEGMPKPMAKAFEQIIEDVAQADVADSWESADAEDSPAKDEEAVVRVYNFPMRPFVSIDVKLQDRAPGLRPDSVMEIARAKKEFDQIDRNLITATKNFIVYALPKHGGLRIISQDSGNFKHLFQSAKERVFNVSICSPVPGSSNADYESIVATGVNGSVFWAPVSPSRGDTFRDDDIEGAGFIFPPVPATDDNTSGGMLKTRAKRSSRHPEYFAIGRGKSIYLIWANVASSAEYTDQQSRVCNSEKYLQHRELKVDVGKGCKDFAFSEDDSAIVTLDKSATLKFWDIRVFQTPSFGNPSGPLTPVEIRTPLMTIPLTSVSDKSWPTSVFFIDKERQYTRGVALRYLLVGLKQNHTLQLWDLALGKPVQEINFPHENESDAICSVVYHPGTGVIAVGHPTRNSIYFIHLSAPKYNLHQMSQVRYLTRLADKDPSVPKPDSTAIMSGVREVSFASKGELRSLDILNSPSSELAPAYDKGDEPLFELYVMHSKGMTCLAIKKEDLGWGEGNRVLHPVDGEAKGDISVSPLRAAPPPAPTPSEPSVSGEAAPSSSKATARETIKKESASTARATRTQTPEAGMIASTLARVEGKQDAARAAIINGSDKAEKKKKNKSSDTASQAPSVAPTASLPSTTPASYAAAAQRAKSPAMATPAIAAPASATPATTASAPQTEAVATPEWATRLMEQLQQPRSIPLGNGVNTADLKKIEEDIAAQFSKTFTKELDTLYRRIDDDKRVQDAAGAAKQDAVLRLVSSTLTDNVEKSLTRIVTASIQDVVMPQLAEIVTSSLNRQVVETIAAALKQAVPREIKTALPPAINQAMHEPEVLRIIADLVSNKVAAHVDAHLANALRTTITPAFTNLAVNSAQQVAGEVERRVGEQIRRFEVQHRSDNGKIEQLTNLVRGLSETVHAMAAAQVATIPFQAELFDRIFVHCQPTYVQQLSPLVGLSVAAAVTATLDTHVAERLLWVDTVFSAINLKDQEIIELAPKIMAVLAQRLQEAYMNLSESNSKDPAIPALLRKISQLYRRANEMKNMTAG
ncbi:hypothetical protein H2199_005003 [Coniosporium tulheliwenetii]|uniref:Uncharacterized protein n=1 Tax=Coniosporium tulheliwenetii TaxID=3383036 RepID=A0ACC2Z3M4_9PEZI|nr:hypothetical protein H2199_005003 [Cladosporium sp. JES 115]